MLSSRGMKLSQSSTMVLSMWLRVRGLQRQPNEDLFKVNDDAVKLDKDKVFHSIVAMILYIVKRARPDAALANAFLTTRFREPDEDDWWKLGH
jgi:hypothetical protein